MKASFSLSNYQSRTLLILGLIIFGFISSKALISVGTALLLVNLLFSFSEHKFQFVKKPNYLVLSPILFFVAGLFLFVFSPDYKLAAKNIWDKLPWLIIPLSIAGIKEVGKNHIILILTLLTFLLVVSGVVVLGNYYINYSFYTKQIMVGKSIPTPLNHIRYSLMAAFAGIVSVYFFIKNDTFLTKYDRGYFAFTSVFLFALLHILSVRSGLICYYAALFYLMTYFAYKYKKWWLLPLLLIVLIGMPFLAYQTIPSFKNKVMYMQYDLQQLGKSDIGHNSDSRRWQSLQIGWELIKQKPLLGHGLGQAENRTKAYYENYFPSVEEHNQKIPHNQFVFTTLELGILGFILLQLAIGIPILGTSIFKNPLYFSLAIIFLLSCFVENTFESQVGMTFYLIYGGLLLKQHPND